MKQFKQYVCESVFDGYDDEKTYNQLKSHKGTISAPFMGGKKGDEQIMNPLNKSILATKVRGHIKVYKKAYDFLGKMKPKPKSYDRITHTYKI